MREKTLKSHAKICNPTNAERKLRLPFFLLPRDRLLKYFQTCDGSESEALVNVI